MAKKFKPKGVLFFTLLTIATAFSCSGPESVQPILKAERPLHLEEQLEAAVWEGAEVPEDALEAVEWHFDKPQPDWKQISPVNKAFKSSEQIQTEDALRLVLDEGTRGFFGSGAPDSLGGIIYVNLPDWKREDWDYISVKVRSTEKSGSLAVLFNVSSQLQNIFDVLGEIVHLEGDGKVHTYTMRADWSRGDWKGPWSQLGIGLAAERPTNIDVLSISIIPKGAKFSTSSVGVSSVDREKISHPVLFMNTPGILSYRVKIPEDGRLDFGLGVFRKDSPVTFKSKIKYKDSDEKIVFEETCTDNTHWIYRSVDLSPWKNRTITLSLETEAENSGNVAFWAKPTILGKSNEKRLNFIIIVLDALRADHMAVYGYHRNTAPNIESILENSLVFKNAYSQAAATPGSTASLFTSTYVSAHGVVMPGRLGKGLPIIDRLPTLAETLKDNGYYTKAISVSDWVSVETGFGKGFEDFEITDPPLLRDRSLDEDQLTTASVVDFLSRDLEQPFFLYVHMFGPHWPYDPPEKFNVFQDKVNPLPPNISKLDEMPTPQTKDFLEQLMNDGKLSEKDLNCLIDRYDGAIYQNDAALKEVFNKIKDHGPYENTMIVITADHGEQLMEHGWIGHWWPYNDTLHVPLIINYPPLFKKREFRDYIVETIGIGATILSQAGIEKPATFKGEDLLLGKDKDYAVSEGIEWWKIQTLKWSLVFKKPEESYELYDLEKDPGENHNIADQHADIVQMMTRQIKGEIKSSITKIKKVQLDQKTIDRLKALGYFK